MANQRIAFVGVGRMGANMARRLKDCGYEVTAVYDINQEAAEALADELACAAPNTLAGVTAEADIVFTVVTDDRAMKKIFTAKRDNLLMEKAGNKVFINCATVSPKIHRELEEAAKAVRAKTLEGCMASSIPQARNGELFLMIGGDNRAFTRVRPILEDLSAELIYVGESGKAAEVKALVNMVMNINTAALAEGLGLGAALGLDLAMLTRVFSQTGANSRVLQTDGDDMIARDHECYFSAAHAAKDSGIALKLAKKLKVNTPLAEATKAQYETLIELGLGELDKSSVAELTFPGRAGTAPKKAPSKKKKKSAKKKAKKS